MSEPRKKSNIGVAHGAWGEEVAAEYLRLRGYVIVARNVRPCRWDARLEIDVIAHDRARNIMVFVEVKQHRARSERARRLQSITREKKRRLRTACRAWLRTKRWQGAYRFDVVEVYGEPGSSRRAEIDHIERVALFADAARYVNWAD